jgi:hypothetical protein
MAHRHHVARPHEDVRLAALHRIGRRVHLRRAQDDEEAVAVALDLGPLVRTVGVLDGQVVQAELLLDALEQLLAGLAEADPDKGVRLPQHLAHLVDHHVAHSPAPGVGHAVDNLACHRISSFALRELISS